MKLLIASDHAGFRLKESVRGQLQAAGREVEDLGTTNAESVDYPDFAAKLAERISRGEAEEGILICGTGIGMSIAANKFPGVRAAVAANPFMAQMAREHNDANVLCLPARVLTEDEARNCVAAWLAARFEGGRHRRRVDKIRRIEAERMKEKPS